MLMFIITGQYCSNPVKVLNLLIVTCLNVLWVLSGRICMRFRSHNIYSNNYQNFTKGKLWNHFRNMYISVWDYKNNELLCSQFINVCTIFERLVLVKKRNINWMLEVFVAIYFRNYEKKLLHIFVVVRSYAPPPWYNHPSFYTLVNIWQVTGGHILSYLVTYYHFLHIHHFKNICNFSYYLLLFP